MAREMWGVKLVAMVLCLLVMAPETMQFSMNHRMYRVVRRINDNSDSHLGIIYSSSRDERALMSSGYFQPDPANPKVMVAGRTIHVGTFNGVPSVVARADDPLANIGATTQALVDMFDIRGIIHYGAAGAVGDINIGDVVVPESVAFTGVWQWQEYQAMMKSDEEELPSFRFGDYNLPEPGENSLASVQLERVTLYSPSGSSQKAFWIPINRSWLSIASSMNVVFDKCFNDTVQICVLAESKLVHGQKAACSDIYLKNVAAANFLSNMGVATVDTTSAAIVATATANGVPSIVFQGASDKPGVEVDGHMKNYAARNVLRAVATFIDTIKTPIPTPHTSSY